MAIDSRLPRKDLANKPHDEPAGISGDGEVDLTSVLDVVEDAAAVPRPLPNDLDGVFAQFRDEASARLSIDQADKDLAEGLALYRAGQLQEALLPLTSASQTARYRFEAASAIGRIFLAEGQAWAAIDWLERAAQAPPPTVEEGHRLLFELADALEAVGETARALAVCLELRALAGEYQDVAMRVARLSKIQVEG